MAKRGVAFLGVLTCLGLSSCGTYQVKSFASDKGIICPGESATLRWEVQGQARLRAERGANDWDEQDVPSTGERSFSETATTTFTLRARQQNPALGNYKKQIVDVATSGPRGNAVTCTAGVCTATFTPASGGVRVRRLSRPVVGVAGRQQPILICVTHPSMSRTCVEAGKEAVVDVAFEGPWMLEATVPATPTPPQKLTIDFDFNCPSQ